MLVSAWFSAVKAGDVNSMSGLLQAQPSLINTQDPDAPNFTALHHAAKDGKTEMMSFLIEQDTFLNSQDAMGNTALIIAAQFNHKDIAEMLVMAGANIDLQNCRGDSALMTAARYNSTEVVAPLIFARANLDLVTRNGNNTALMIAAGWDYTQISTPLIIAGANLEIENSNGCNALAIAKNAGFTRTVFLLKKAVLQGKRRSQRSNENNAVFQLSQSGKRTMNNCVHQWEINITDLKFQGAIGRGGFGEVSKATLKGTPVAVKTLQGPLTEAMMKDFRGEMEFMAEMRHPNICLFMAACLQAPRYALVTELLIYGSLWDALRTQNPQRQTNEAYETPAFAWPWSIIERIAYGVTCGMTFLHTNNPPIIHRDLKSSNILLGEGYVAKVADLGLARLKDAVMTQGVGTYQWMAPEVLESQSYQEAADVFSFAVICWELLTRNPPYAGMETTQILKSVTKEGFRLPIPEWCPAQYNGLIQGCWKHNPKERPSFNYILERFQWTVQR